MGEFLRFILWPPFWEARCDVCHHATEAPFLRAAEWRLWAHERRAHD